MQVVGSIVNHGDMTDVSFIEKTLGAKFTSGYFVTRPDGRQDTQDLIYQTDQALGYPISVTLWVYGSKEDPLRYHSISSMSIDNKSPLHFGANFIMACLHIPTVVFYSYFGEGFLGGVINGRGAATKVLPTPGKNGSRISLNIAYGPEDNLVGHIGIAQRL